MAYILEKITHADREKILADADSIKRSHLHMRGGYFEDGIDFFWAIDRERDMYLLGAPTVESRSSYAYFYFHINSVMYRLRVKKSKDEAVQLDELPPQSLFNQFKNEVMSAFAVHGLCGLPDGEPPFLPFFEEVKR